MLGPMVRHYALKPKASTHPYLLKTLAPRPDSSVGECFQQVRTYGSLRVKGIVSEDWLTALAVTYIVSIWDLISNQFGIKCFYE